jgi:hypothetical protein
MSPRLARLARALVLAIAACAFLAPAAGATPSRFVLEYCDTALPQTSDPGLVFSVNPPAGVPVRWFNDCLKPTGSIGIQEVGNSGDASATLAVSIPATPGGYVESESILGGTAALGAANTQVYIYAPGWPYPNGGEDLRVFRIRNAPPPVGPATGDFTIGWNCVGPLNSCSAGPIVYARDISVTEVDPNPPTVSAGGALLSGQVARGTQALEATAQDVGGGVSRIEVLVNGTAAAPPTPGNCTTVKVANPGYEGIAAVSPSPCPGRLGASWQLDTTAGAFHNGANQVQVCASDFATGGAPNTTCSPTQTVEVDNSCTESAVAGGANLVAGFRPTGGETIRLRRGRGAEIKGTLTDAAGNPVSGATICVQSQTEGAALVPVATVSTDPNGRFNYGVSPGPNRQILIGYRHGSFELARTLKLSSSPRPTLRARPRKLHNGERVRLQGKLPGPSAAGRVVVLQAGVPGSRRWITFRKATTGARGRFKARYHFTSTTRRITYRFRALVPRQAGYPWNQGASRPAKVTVVR